MLMLHCLFDEPVRITLPSGEYGTILVARTTPTGAGLGFDMPEDWLIARNRIITARKPLEGLSKEELREEYEARKLRGDKPGMDEIALEACERIAEHTEASE